MKFFTLKKYSFLPFICGLLVACSHYEVTVNENVVYTPPPLFQDYQIKDPSLRRCIAQHIEEGNITAPEQLERLRCSHAGIASLEGLNIFMRLKELDLSHNQLADVSLVSRLPKLEVLHLEDNRLISTPEILQLAHLKSLNLRQNTQLDCRDALQLMSDFKGDVELPEHCRQNQ